LAGLTFNCSIFLIFEAVPKHGPYPKYRQKSATNSNLHGIAVQSAPGNAEDSAATGSLGRPVFSHRKRSSKNGGKLPSVMVVSLYRWMVDEGNANLKWMI
jgi:hypothetical protein